VAPIVLPRAAESQRPLELPYDVESSPPLAAVVAKPSSEPAPLPILTPTPVIAIREEPKPVAASATLPSTAWIDLPKVPRACALPTISELSDSYFDLVERMGEQLAENYCNVVLFATPDRFSDAGFSLTQLAQVVALQSPGDVLLVDGDLIGRRLSKSVCPGNQGLVEVMLGVAQWPDVVHTTNLACIDFVSCGQAQVPTLERSQFGWEALRPQYRAVLIGLSEVPRPETNWLAARCDAVYLVLARRHTQRQAASAATSALRACGANLVGCVVTED
jgi:Mrp family chromosome partitioning ATPase